MMLYELQYMKEVPLDCRIEVGQNKYRMYKQTT